MSEWALLAPGPSAPALIEAIPSRVRLGVIANAYQLVPCADFLAAADRGWWIKHPDAQRFSARKFCNTHPLPYAEFVGLTPDINSGVLGLHIAATLGATRIRLYGFDMHGSHFFGRYANGLRNTSEERRAAFFQQYAKWAVRNGNIDVTNCTPGSALTCFPMERELP